MKTKKNSIAVSIMLVGLMLAILSGFAVFYMKDLTTNLKAETNAYLSEISQQSVKTVKKQIDGDLSTLHDLAEFIGAQEDLDLNRILSTLKGVCENNGFKRMGIITPDGIAHTTDHMEMDFSDRAYFYDAFINGDPSVTGVLIDKADSEPIHVYATPIYKQDKAVAVIFATHHMEVYQELLSISTFDGRGYSYIVQSTGELVVDTAHPGRDPAFTGLDSLFHNPDATVYADGGEIKFNMLLDKSGILEYTVNGVVKYMDYTPIGVNDWYLLSVAPASVVSERSNYILTRTLFLYIGVIGLFTLLFVYILVFQHQSKKRLEQLAYYDGVTGVHNLSWFQLDAKNLLEKHTQLHYAMVQLDVDKFKYINDMFGYEEGNRTLCHIAACLQEQVKSNEAFCRVANDHFLLLLRYSTTQDLSNRIEQIRHAICAPSNEHTQYALILSSGVYKVTDPALPITTLIERANLAHKTSKDDGKGACIFYSDCIRDRLLEEKDIENHMRAALQNGEFVVYLQPKIELGTRKVSGAEALVRWNRPGKGLIGPDQFIPMFERNGFILELDLYIFRQVCKRLRLWLDCGLTPVPIAVNLSRVHLHNMEFIEKYQRVAEHYRIPPRLIELELTESVVFDNFKIFMDLVRELHQVGFALSMDDFGAGYSSLNLLKELPVDILKLDREFFRETANNDRGKTVICGVVSMAKELNIRVVAEGVETEVQAAFLKKIGCDMAQGFLYAKPMPMGEFEAYVFGRKLDA